MKLLICGIGHTAAGKTTTLRALSQKMNVSYISEGAIKRNLVGESFDVNNSMDEELRSRGYKIAISKAFDILKEQDCVILDASFHQLFRRMWVYDEAANFQDKIGIIWIYCYCDNIIKVSDRIKKRANEKVVNADIQARSMEVFYYTMRTFDNVKIKDFPKTIATAIIFNNTDMSRIDNIESNDNSIVIKSKEIGDLIYG